MDFVEKLENETPPEALLYIKAFAHYIVTSFSEDKHKAYDYVEYFLNRMLSDDERIQLDEHLSKAIRRSNEQS